MNYSIYRFTLDIHRTKSQVSIPVLFHDTGIQFYISLADGGKPYFIEDGCRAVFSAKKPDGATLFNDCIIEDNTRIRYDFTEQTTNCEGMMNCEIRLYGTDGNLLTTPAFVVVVDPRVIYDSEVLDSYPEATLLDNMVSAENARLVGEQKRVDAEAVRVIVENARAAAEAERIAAENARVAAEVVRGDAEAERIANEAERVAAYAHMIGSWVAYSAHEDGTDYTWTWSEGQRYIGICNGKTPPQDKTGFVWSKFVDTGIYVGSGDMPSWCDLQIDPDGDVTEIVQTPGQSTTNVMSQKAVSDSFANALVGSSSGEMVVLDDVSPIAHEIGVRVRSKNILPYPYNDTTKTENGITFTDNGDGSITANGTATADATFVLFDNVPYGEYKDYVYKFSDYFPTKENNTLVYHGNWELGCYNPATNEYLKYNTTDPDGNWACYDGDVWGDYSGFGINPTHDNARDFGGRNTATHRPCVCFNAPKNGHVHIWLNEFANTTDWTLEIYQNGLYRGSMSASNKTLGKMNDDLAKIDITLSEGDYIYFVAVRTGNNWSCKMMPCVTYEADTNGVEIDTNGVETDICISGCPAGGSAYTYHILSAFTGLKDTGAGRYHTGRARYFHFNIIIKSGYTANNLVFLPMIEIGKTKTAYVPYMNDFSTVKVVVTNDNDTPTTYPVSADGVVQGEPINSIYPCTTLMTDTVGAVMDVTYNRDANKVVNELETRLAALEAAALN